ncbi:hypothetical protein PM082_020637 [Marasmius tenuissimus]|nr:hypothetical protein PM082_020637 [Marasmius tenuissimus]
MSDADKDILSKLRCDRRGLRARCYSSGTFVLRHRSVMDPELVGLSPHSPSATTHALPTRTVHYLPRAHAQDPIAFSRSLGDPGYMKAY